MWCEHMTVNSHDCDENRILRPTGLFRMVQEAANLHLRSMNQDETEMRRCGKAYIVSTIGIDVKKPIMMNDKLCVRTWEANSSGVKYLRYYSVLRDGEEVAIGNCVCAMIDINNGKFIRVADCGYVFCSEGESRTPSLDCRTAIRKNLDYKYVGDFYVVYPFIDRNHHMNNTCYADMLYSAILDCTKKAMSAISISYMRQARLGDKLLLYVAEEDGKYYVKSVFEDGNVNAAAVITAFNVQY